MNTKKITFKMGGLSTTLESNSDAKDWSYLTKVRLRVSSKTELYDFGENILDSVLIEFRNAFSEASDRRSLVKNTLTEFSLGFYFQIYSYRRWSDAKNLYLDADEVMVQHSNDYYVLDRNGLGVWVYNTIENNVIIEISPMYPNIERLEGEERNVDFRNWMENYSILTKEALTEGDSRKVFDEIMEFYKTLFV